MDKQFLKGLVDKESINEKDGTISVAVATDSSVDRDGEIIETAGIDTTNFEKNPVLLYAHDYRSDPIGKVLQIIKEQGRMLFKPQFAVDASPRAKQYFELVKGGFLNAFSIGFIPKKWEDRQLADGSTQRVFTVSELLEISLVPVPANPNALVLAREYKGIDGKGFDAEVLKELEQNLEKPSEEEVIPPAEPPVEAEEKDTDQRIHILETEVVTLKETVASLADNRESEVKANQVDELLRNPNFTVDALKSIDMAVGKALRDIKRGSLRR